jgi:uncharacterized protein YcnI
MRRPIAFAAVTAAVLAAVVTTATPASAHTEVSAKNARALAENVTLEFHAESESASAAITKLEVVLPDGITFADITYKEGPEGWKLTATDDGYAVSGPDLVIGEEAESQSPSASSRTPSH